MFNSLRSVCTHIISAVALAIALYFAYVLDLDTVLCFLALQEIKFEQKNTAKSPVDLLSSILPAQSVSENALTRVESDF
jgi:Na+/H+-dicarboxylate symporter